MRTKSKPAFSVILLVLLLMGWSKTCSYAAIVTYDPGLNSLPQAQGFTLIEDPPASPTPSVGGGFLNQGQTTLSGDQFFERSDVPFNFDSGFTLAVTLKVASSTYNPNGGGPGSQRSGWYMEGIDEMGRRFTIGVDSGGVVVNTDPNLLLSNGFSVRPFDTTNAFHRYRLVVSGGMGTLFIDGAAVGAAPVGGVVDPGSSNRVYFGDGTASGNSQTQLSFFQYADSPLPESPPLTISPGTNGVLLAWPASDTNFVLQATTNLAPPVTWTSVTNEAHLRGDTISVVVNVDKPQRFFRLQK